MAFGGVIKWFTEVDPTPGIAGAKATADGVEHEVNRIDRMKAVVDLGAEDRELKRKVKEAKDELHELSAMKSDPDVELDTGTFDAEYARIQRKIKTLNAQRVNITVNVADHRAAISQVNNLTTAERKQAATVSKLRQEYAKTFTALEKASKRDFGDTHRERLEAERLTAHLHSLESQIHDLGGSTHDLHVNLDKNTFSFRRLADRIGNTRVRIGPLSMSMKALGAVSVFLGPAILGAVGALGALVGVAGTSLLGALAAASAGLAGFGLAAIGMTMALKPVVAGLGAAFKASKAYSDAVIKYGDDSSQASDKLEQLHNTLRGIPPEARKAFVMFGQMRAEFQKITGPTARRDFFSTFSEGVKTANALMPIFANETRRTMDVASKGVNQWLQGLRSPEAKQAFADIMGNFRKSLPDLLAGLGHIGAMFGRVSQSASKFLPGLTGGFEQWASNLEESIGSGDELDRKVGRLIDHMRSLGHFAQASGGALATFFNLGADSGQDLLDSMTRSLTRWQSAMEADPSGTTDFFQQSVDTIKQLGPALGRSLLTLANLAEAFAPMAEGASKLFNAIATGAALIPGPVFQAVGALYALRKAMAFTTAVTGFEFAMGGAAAASTVAATETKAAAGQMAFAEAEMGGAAAGATGLRAAMIPLGVTVGAIVGGAFGLQALDKALGEHISHMSQGVTAYERMLGATRAYRRSEEDLTASQQQASKSWKRANELIDNGKTHTKAYSRTVNQLGASITKASDAQREHKASAVLMGAELSKLKTQYQQQKDLLGDLEVNNESDLKNYQAQALALGVLGSSVQAANVQFARLRAGAKEASPALLGALRNLQKFAGKKIASKFSVDSESAVRATQTLAGRLTHLTGSKQQAIKILADSSSATEALVRFMRAVNQAKPKPISLKARTDDAVAAFHRVNNEAPKDKTVKIKAQDAATPTLRSINAEMNRLHDKTFTVTEVHKIIGKAFGAGGVQTAAYPTGGITQRMVDHSAERAAHMPTRDPARGREVNRPTFLAGDRPGDTEWIVTDNPAFRGSNTGYLTSAASALGYMLIPAFASGGHKKANKKAAATTKRANKKLGGAGNAGGLAAQWDDMVALQEYWSDEYDLDRRSYDSGLGTGGSEPGYALGDLLNDLEVQINAYTAMKGLLPAMRNLHAIPDVHVPSGAKGKAKKHAVAAKARVDAFNSAVGDAKGDIEGMDEKTIEHLIRGLRLEQLEIQSAQANNQLLGTSQAQTQTWAAFQQFGSNIGGIGGAQAPGGSSLASLTPPTPNFVVPSADVLPSFGGGSGAADSGFGGPTTVGANSIQLITNWGSAPPDPMTWSQQAAFELGAI